MERGEYIQRCEKVIHDLEEKICEEAGRSYASRRLLSLASGWLLAQEEWLLIARGMSTEKARAVISGWAVGELSPWIDESKPGSPPSVLTLYDGPLSDEEFEQIQTSHRKRLMEE